MAFTWPRNPQKPQMRSAHLKFGGSNLKVFERLHLGQSQDLATGCSPQVPNSCFEVAIAP